MPDQTPDRDRLEELAALAALRPAELTDDERDELETALAVDPALAAHLDELSALVAALPAAPPLETPVETPPPALRHRVLTAVAAEAGPRGSWSTRVVPLVAAAAVAVVVGVGIGRATVPVPPPPPLQELALDVAAFPVTEADLIAHTWGAELLFVLEGTTSGETYTVTVTGTDGTEFAAGSFLGDGTRSIDCEMNVALLAEDAAGFEVTDEAGRVVVAGPLPGGTGG